MAPPAFRPDPWGSGRTAQSPMQNRKSTTVRTSDGDGEDRPLGRSVRPIKLFQECTCANAAAGKLRDQIRKECDTASRAVRFLVLRYAVSGGATRRLSRIQQAETEAGGTNDCGRRTGTPSVCAGRSPKACFRGWACRRVSRRQYEKLRGQPSYRLAGRPRGRRDRRANACQIIRKAGGIELAGVRTHETGANFALTGQISFVYI